MLLWQLSQYHLTKLFWMKVKTTKHYKSLRTEKTKLPFWPTLNVLTLGQGSVFGFHSFYNQHKKADSRAIDKANDSLAMVPNILKQRKKEIIWFTYFQLPGPSKYPASPDENMGNLDRFTWILSANTCGWFWQRLSSSLSFSQAPLNPLCDQSLTMAPVPNEPA